MCSSWAGIGGDFVTWPYFIRGLAQDGSPRSLDSSAKSFAFSWRMTDEKGHGRSHEVLIDWAR